MSKTTITIRNLTINITPMGSASAAAAVPKPAFAGALAGDDAMLFMASLFGDRFMTDDDLVKAANNVPPVDPVDPPVAQQDGVKQPGDTRITTANISQLDIGDGVWWQGAKYDFYGVVENIEPVVSDDEKLVFVRRDDTGALVSLTADDIDTHTLTKLEPTE
jgi:hypothetical protein